MSLSLLLLLTISTPASAETNWLRWPHGRRAADWASTGLAAGALVAGGVTAWRAPNRARALACYAGELGAGLVANEAVKRLVHRERPDHSDSKSFWSMHTMLATIAMVDAGPHHVAMRWTIPIGVAVGRGGADAHYPSDTLAGGIAGYGFAQMC